MMRVTVPSVSVIKVVRYTPMYVRPAIFFLAIYAEFLHEFEFCVAEKWKRKIVFFNELVVRFRILCAANITSKQKSDMTKVAIKNENITSFGGIYIISLWLFILPHWFGWEISCLCKNQESRKIPISMDKSQKCHFNTRWRN